MNVTDVAAMENIELSVWVPLRNGRRITVPYMNTYVSSSLPSGDLKEVEVCINRRPSVYLYTPEVEGRFHRELIPINRVGGWEAFDLPNIVSVKSPTGDVGSITKEVLESLQ